MVKQELSDAYEKLNKRNELYKKAVQKGNVISGFGVLILILSIFLFPFIPASFYMVMGTDFEVLWATGMLLGFSLIVIGRIVNGRALKPPKLSANEETFLFEIIEVLRSLDTYSKERIEFSKIEAIKGLSKVEKSISEPSVSSYRLWNALTKDVTEDLRLLKRNLKERLFPILSQDDKEKSEKAYSLIESFAGYLLDPQISNLRNLNQLLSELPSSITTVATSPRIPFLERHPRIRHAVIEIIFCVIGYMSYYIGNLLEISTNINYPLAWTIWVALTAGYMARVLRKD